MKNFGLLNRAMSLVFAPNRGAGGGVAEFAGAGPSPSMGMDVEPSPWIDINEIIASGDISTGAMQTLAGAINAIPYEPSYLGDRKLYTYDSKKTNTVALEFDGQTISLVQTTAPGSPMPETILNPRNVKSVNSTRIARRVTVMASEVANIREIGGGALDTVQARQNWKLRNAIRDIRSTLEWHRVGGALGSVLDADGTVIQSFFSLLGITQTTIDCAQATAATAKYITIAETVLNYLEDALGSLTPIDDRPPIVLCGRNFWNRFTTSADVITAYQYFMANRQKLIPGRDDLRYGDFEHGGLIWRQYRGSTAGSGFFIPTNEAHVILDGVPGTYLAHLCPPQDIVDRVNQDGQLLDVTMEVLPHKKGVQIEMQCNPIHWMNRPGAAIKLYSSN